MRNISVLSAGDVTISGTVQGSGEVRVKKPHDFCEIEPMLITNNLTVVLNLRNPCPWPHTVSFAFHPALMEAVMPVIGTAVHKFYAQSCLI